MSLHLQQLVKKDWGQAHSCPLHVTLHFRFQSLERICLEEASSFALSISGEIPERQSTLIQWFEAFLAGSPSVFPLPLNTALLAPFTQRVLDHLKSIPFGETRSYKDVAIAIGTPGGARAVGNACGANPYPLVIPCHRVLKTGGGLGGFALGSSIKQILLDLESAHIKL